MARSDRLIVRTTLRQWNHRARRAPSEIAYLVYVGILVGAIVLVPVIRAVWLLLAEPAALAVLTAPPFSAYVVAAVLIVLASATAPWTAPAARRPFLARVLSDTPAAYAASFSGPVWRYALCVVAIAGGVAALLQGVLASAGLTSAAIGISVVIAAMATGVIATVVALVSQAWPRIGMGVSISLVAGALVVAITLPDVSVLASLPSVAGLSALALTLAAATPLILNRMRPRHIMAASIRRDGLIVGATLMDASAIDDAAVEVPAIGRRWMIGKRVPLALSFATAAAVGAARTPARLVRSAAVLLAGFALAAVVPSGWVVAAASALVYLGLGGFVTALKHAALAVRTTPMYGVSDAALLGMHAIFPASVALVASVVGFVGGTPGFALCLTIAIAAIAARVFAALTPPTPLSLLMPIPTPAGDAAALLRVGWALQGLILVGATSVALLPAVHGIDPWRFVWVTAVAATIMVARWRNRS